MFASAIAVVTAITPAAVTDAWIWRPVRTPGLGVAVPVVVTRCDSHGRGRSCIAVTDAWIWRPGRTTGLGVAVPVVVTRCDNCGRRRSRIAVTNTWIWRPGRTAGLGINVPIVVARCANSGRGRSGIDWPAAGNKSSAGKARGVVPDDAAPRRAAIQYADIGSCRHRADDVEAEAGSATQIEIVGECCCRDRTRG